MGFDGDAPFRLKGSMRPCRNKDRMALAGWLWQDGFGWVENGERASSAVLEGGHGMNRDGNGLLFAFN